jgi:hypothetical protein
LPTDGLSLNISVFLEKSVQKINLPIQSDHNDGTLHAAAAAAARTVIITSVFVILRMTNVSDSFSCRDNQTTQFVFSKFFFINRAVFLDKVEKYCRVGQVTDGNMAHAHCMLDN